MNKFNDYQMHRMIYLLRLSFCIDEKNKYIPDTKVNDTPNNSTNNKISLEDYPIDLVNLDEILEESHHI